MIPLLIGSSVLALDQLSKEIAMRRPGSAPVLNAYTKSSRRPGLAGSAAIWSLLVLAAVLLARRAPLSGDSIALAGLGATLGGAAGNLIDRFRRGAIVDFISIPWWPAFNLADAAIVVGILLPLEVLL